MRPMRIGRLAVATLVAVMLLGGQASGLVVLLPPVQFAVSALAGSASDWDFAPVIDGKLVAWQSTPGPAHSDPSIIIRNLATGESRVIGSGDGRGQYDPDVSGDYVVWEEWNGSSFDVRMYDWRSGQSWTVANTGGNGGSPRIDGNLVVWKEGSTDWLYYRDYDTAGGGNTWLMWASNSADEFDVDNGRIVWLDQDTDRLWVYTPRAPGFDGMLVDYGGNISFLDLHGDRIAFTYEGIGPNYDVEWYDIRARTTTLAAVDSGWEWDAAVFHNTFAWLKPGPGGSDLAYGRPNHVYSTIASNEGDNSTDLYGRRIVYQQDTGPAGDYDAMLATGNEKLAGRTYGANRYATAVNVSKAYFSKATNVVLCTGENFPDALAAAPLARALEAPLLLTRKDQLLSDVAAEITRLGATQVYVIGGTPTLSATVASQVDALPGVSVERIAGANRYATSALIAQKLQATMGANFVFRAFFTRGDNFPDALAVGPVAAGALGPILLVQPTAVPTSVASAIDSLNITLGYVIGDTNSVSAGTYTAIRNRIIANGAIGPSIERWAGSNRYATAAQVITQGLAHNWIDLDTLGVAVGTKFPDALGGGAALGYYGSPVLLTSGTALSGAANTFLLGHAYDIGRVDVFGDSNSVSASVYNQIVATIQ